MKNEYRTRYIVEYWAPIRKTHPAVAMAIHAIADAHRTADSIWESPTKTERDSVMVMVAKYTADRLYPAEPNGRYPWGQESIIIPVEESLS